MRGSTAKLLRKRNAARYVEWAAMGRISEPESLEHMRHQRRVMYRGLKKAYTSLSSAEKGRYLASLRKWLTESSSPKQS